MGLADSAGSALMHGTDWALKEVPLLGDAVHGVKTAADVWQQGLTPSTESEIVGTGAQTAADFAQASSWLGLPEDLLIGVGPLVGGLAQAAAGAVGAHHHRDQADQGVLENDKGGRNEFWQNTGDTLLGGIHGVLGGIATGAIMASGAELFGGPTIAGELVSIPAVGMAVGADLAVSGAEGLANTVGFGAGLLGDGFDLVDDYVDGPDGTDGRDWYFSAGDILGGAAHLGVNAASGLFDHMAD